MNGKFKTKGKDILGRRPTSMKAFLEDSEEDFNEANHLNALNHNPAMDNNPYDIKEEVRLHIHIRKDLADQLFDLVLNRKKNPGIKNKHASQRVIIEESLQEYFENHRS